MNTLLGTYSLPSPSLGYSVDINLYQGIEEQQVKFIEDHWMPTLKARQDRAIIKVNSKSIQDDHKRRAAFQVALTAAGAPDGHWNWRQKVSSLPDSEAHGSFYTSMGSSVEAVLQCRLLHYARESSQQSQPSVYVNYVAVAPWNRKEIQNPRKVSSLGYLMMATAVSLSMSEGFAGRIGLHSLPQAESFYQHCGMVDLGCDAQYSGLRYFEFTPQLAANFIQS